MKNKQKMKFGVYGNAVIMQNPVTGKECLSRTFKNKVAAEKMRMPVEIVGDRRVHFFKKAVVPIYGRNV